MPADDKEGDKNRGFLSVAPAPIARMRGQALNFRCFGRWTNDARTRASKNLVHAPRAPLILKAKSASAGSLVRTGYQVEASVSGLVALTVALLGDEPPSPGLGGGWPRECGGD
jgi:hypothetical protein